MDISIIILTYNRRETLKQCLENILRWTEGIEYEVVVVNNASTDGTEYLLESYSKRFKNFTFINMPENIGVIARNEALKIAKGKFIAQCDDDVLLQQNWVKDTMKHFDAPDVGAVGPEGSNWAGWLEWNHNTKEGDYVDFLTGQFWVWRNDGLLYDEIMGKFWHEECVSGQRYIPCLINNIVEFVTIQDLFNRGKIIKENDKEVSTVNNIKILSTTGEKNKNVTLFEDEKNSLNGIKHLRGVHSNGYRSKNLQESMFVGCWSDLKCVTRFNINQRKDRQLIMVNQKFGETVCTGDHSLIDNNFNPTKPRDLKIWGKIGYLPEVKEFVEQIDLLEFIKNEPLVQHDDNWIWFKVDKKKEVNKAKRFIPIQSRHIFALLELMAAYTTEGSIHKNSWSISNTDKNWITKLKKQYGLMFLIKPHVVVSRDKRGFKTLYNLYKTDKITSVLFKSLCGQYSKNKKFPSFVFSLPIKHRLFFLQKLIQGDGYIPKKAVNGQRKENLDLIPRFTSTSYLLTCQFIFLITQLGKFYNIRRNNLSKRNSKWNDAYEISVRSHFLDSRIKTNTTKLPLEEWVYDLTVDKTHVFTDALGLVLLHNSEYQLRIRHEKKYRFKQSSRTTMHHLQLRQAKDMDWVLHNKNLKHVIDKWKPLENELGLEGKKSRRILFVSHGFPCYMSDIIFHGLTRLGHVVVEYPVGQHYYGEWDGRGKDDFLSFCNFHFRKPVWKEEELLKIDYDCVIMTSWRPEQPWILENVRKAYAGRIPFIYVDGEEDGVPVRNILCDMYFKREHDPNYTYPKMPRVRPINFAVIDEIQPKIYNEKTYNVSFIAAGHEPDKLRCQIFRKLKEENGFSGVYARDVEHEGFQWIPYTEYSDVLSKSLVGVSVRGVGEDSYRLWEVPYHGAVLLSDKLKMTTLNNFTDMENAVFFEPNVDDFVDKLKWLIDNQDKAKEIAKKGREHVLKYHLSIHRAQYILDELDKIR